MRFTQHILLLVMLCCLAACGTLNSEFDCHAPLGVSCRPLSEVDHKVASGEFQPMYQSSAVSRELSKPIGSVQATYVNPDPMFKSLRQQESVLRVWIAPYADTEGNYHAASYVYTVVEPAHWMEPVSKVTGTSSSTTELMHVKS